MAMKSLWNLAPANLVQVPALPDFEEYENLLVDFWRQWLSGSQFTADLQEELQAVALVNSDFAAAFLYSKLNLPVGERLSWSGELALSDVFDAAVLGHPESALIAAEHIASIIRPSDIVTLQTTELSPNQQLLINFMNNFYGKGWIIK